MLSVPGAKTVRGYSFFGDSFVYVLFEDGTDLYWARSRVLEYLNQVQSRLPASAKAALGPDATGVGWVYEYALVDRSGTQDLSQLRALQDWFLKYELKTVPNVAEVASVGGMVRQYQVVLDPDKLRAYGIPHAQGRRRDPAAPTRRAGGSVLELGEAEYMVRASGYLQSLDDFRKIPLTTTDAGVSVRLRRRRARSRSGPRCAAASPSSTARARSPAASSSCARARTRSRRSTRSRPSSQTLQAEPAARASRSCRPTTARSLIERAVDNLAQQAGRGVRRRRAGLRRVPVPPALGAGRDRLAAARHPGGLHRHALPGRQRQHHVARRHRDRDRRDGRRGGRDDRERAQAHRALAPRASGRDASKATSAGA